MDFKTQVYKKCASEIEAKISHLQNVLIELKLSAANETKSTAGDKYETALAMLQIEQASTSKQLQIFKEQQLVLQKINPLHSAPTVCVGSLVNTSLGNFFVSIAIGKMEVNSVVVFAISPQSPLGTKLFGLKVGDNANLNSKLFLINSIG